MRVVSCCSCVGKRRPVLSNVVVPFIALWRDVVFKLRSFCRSGLLLLPLSPFLLLLLLSPFSLLLLFLGLSHCPCHARLCWPQCFIVAASIASFFAVIAVATVFTSSRLGILALHS